MVNIPDYDIRYSTIEDGEHLKKWLLVPEDQKWFPMSTPQEVEEGAKNWIGFSKFKASLTATAGGDPCGVVTLFLMPYRKVAHHALFYLIVEKHSRRKGVGESLLKNIMHLAKQNFHLELVHVEVFDGCPILPLLLKHGFTVYAKQERFVKDGNEYLGRTLLECNL
ncbi:MAG TPA: GNAT family N-acetyltransferase [Chlamydiales bacterium]|nr:GNAT family N-acetyltransferase [Chlamydiales bacterium]